MKMKLPYGCLAALLLSASGAAVQGQPPATDVPSFTAQGAFVAIVVTDLDASVHWYESNLGLHLVRRGKSPRGDGKPTYALVLIAGENPKRRAELIVAHQLAEGWEIRSLDVTDGTPVVWRDRLDKYEGMPELNTTGAKNPVIVFCGLESWAVLYAWNRTEVEKLQLSD